MRPNPSKHDDDCDNVLDERLWLLIKYTTYGEERSSSGEMPTRYKYTGQLDDNYIKLIWMGSRWYNPALSRFISPDSIVPDKGNPQGLDRYAYVANHPISRVDTSGHCWGMASGIRGLPSYDTTCNNLDMALMIVQSDKTTMAEKAGAGTYIAFEGAAHATFVAGVGLMACSAVAPCVKAVETAMGIGTAACVDGDCTNELEVSAKIGQDVWRMNPFDRGWEIERAIGRTPNLVPNFPTINRFVNGVATSIKSIDLSAKIFQNVQALTSTVQGYVMKLANFSGETYGGFQITAKEIIGRELILAIPPNASTNR